MFPPGGSSPPSGLPSCSAAMESLCLVRLECTSANHCETGSWWTSSEGPAGCRWGGEESGGIFQPTLTSTCSYTPLSGSLKVIASPFDT